MLELLNETKLGERSLAQILWALLLAGVCLLVIWLVVKYSNKALGHTKLGHMTQKTILSAEKVLLCFLTVILVCSKLNINMDSLVAILGIASAAVALAAQTILSNLFDGVILLVNHPFRVGDRIQTGEHAGIVTEMGTFYTRLVTAEQRIVSIPNSEVFSGRIINYNNDAQNMVQIQVTASYSDGLDEVLDALREAVNRTDKVLPEDKAKQPIFIRLSAYQDSAIQYTIRVWCLEQDYGTVYFGLLENVKRVYDERGISIPFPQMDVHIPER